MVRWYTVHPLAAILIAGVTLAPVDARSSGAPGVVLDGVARTGTDTRPVRFRFFCSSNNGPNVTGVLSVELEIPRYEQLRAIFDFDPFEGPDANAGPLTLLRASGVRTKASDRFRAAGSVQENGSTESFVLEVSASRRQSGPPRKLAAALRPLVDGPGILVWHQGSAKPGGTPMRASLDLVQAQTDQLRTALGPCLGGR